MFGREAQHLADLAHGAARAVGDHIGGHRGAALPVAAVDVLDDLLALIAAGQIDIDVGPFAALLGEKALEQQLHPDRVDRGDSQRVADRAVGRRAAPLRHDPVLAAELYDVPYDEEIAGEAELRDYFELVRELAEHTRTRRRPPTLASPGLDQHPQVAVGRLAGRQRIARKAVAEVTEFERAALGDRARGGDRTGEIAKQRGHL